MQRVGGINAKWRPPWWSIAASTTLLAALAAGTWGVLDDDSGASPLARIGLPVALLLTSGVAAFAGVQARFQAQQRAWAETLHAARDRLQCIDEVIDLWQFRTDASHRIIELRPPGNAALSDWGQGGQGAALWELFRSADDAALQARMTAGAPLAAVDVQRMDAAGAHPGVLRARPYHDALARFAGYHGVVRDTAVPMQAAPAATPPADGPSAEQESFSYTVSHDLRAPIRVVEGFTKIIKEDYGRLLDRVGNDHLDRVLGAAARMNNMIDALLALSRLASQPLVRQPVNLSQLAGYVADDLRRQSPERQVALTIEPGIQLNGDPTLLRVVLENLLGNAWKYTAKSAQAQVVLERHASMRDTYTVRDNGAGFDMRFADRLFGVFQRLHSANDFAGTGIGLASVRRIVRRHGGEIWGEAEVHRGAKFHFSLPDASLPEAPSPGASSSQASLQRVALPQAPFPTVTSTLPDIDSPAPTRVPNQLGRGPPSSTSSNLSA